MKLRNHYIKNSPSAFRAIARPIGATFTHPKPPFAAAKRWRPPHPSLVLFAVMFMAACGGGGGGGSTPSKSTPNNNNGNGNEPAPIALHITVDGQDRASDYGKGNAQGILPEERAASPDDPFLIGNIGDDKKAGDDAVQYRLADPATGNKNADFSIAFDESDNVYKLYYTGSYSGNFETASDADKIFTLQIIRTEGDDTQTIPYIIHLKDEDEVTGLFVRPVGDSDARVYSNGEKVTQNENNERVTEPNVGLLAENANEDASPAVAILIGTIGEDPIAGAGTITYATTTAGFSITDGKLFYIGANAGDYESDPRPKYTITITRTDSNNPNNIESFDYVILLQNLNDNDPVLTLEAGETIAATLYEVVPNPSHTNDFLTLTFAGLPLASNSLDIELTNTPADGSAFPADTKVELSVTDPDGNPATTNSNIGKITIHYTVQQAAGFITDLKAAFMAHPILSKYFIDASAPENLVSWVVTGEATITNSDISGFQVASGATEAIADFNGTDKDGDILTYSLSDSDGGTDGDSSYFTIDKATGELRFNDKNWPTSTASQNGDNIYEITVTVTETTPEAKSVSRTLQIEVVPAVLALAFPENTPTGSVISYFGAGTYTITGDDATDFTIDDANGELKFAAAPDYENERGGVGVADNTYNITLTDSVGGTITNIEITISDVQESFTLPENTPTSAVIYDFGAGTYTLSGDDAGDFTIVNGELKFAAVPDFENTRGAGNTADNTYNVTITASDGTITNIEVTISDVQETFPVLENTPASAVIHDFDSADAGTFSMSGTDAPFFAFDTANGELKFLAAPDFENTLGTGGAAKNTYRVTITDSATGTATPIEVMVQNVEEIAIAENTATSDSVFSAGAGTYTLSGDDAADFTIDDVTGDLKFAAMPDFEAAADANTDNIYKVILTDSVAGTITHVEITINDVLDYVVDENTETSYIIYDFLPQRGGGSIRISGISLSGDDAGDFNLTDLGVLSFKVKPDFENPHDENTNNVYEVRFSGGQRIVRGEVVEIFPALDLQIVVRDVPEIIEVDENIAGPVHIFGGTGTLSVSGTDAGDFTFLNNVLFFNDEPDYEMPDDANTDNTYNITVTRKTTDNTIGKSDIVTASVSHIQIVVKNVVEAGDPAPTAAEAIVPTAKDPANKTLQDILKAIEAEHQSAPQHWQPDPYNGDSDMIDLPDTGPDIL